MTTQLTDPFKESIDALRSTLILEELSQPFPPDYFRFRMKRRQRLARYLSALPKLAFEQGVGQHKGDKFPVWAEPREVDLYATNIVELGSHACAVVDFKMKDRPRKWVETALVLVDNHSSDVFDTERRLFTANNGELYMPNYLTPDPNQQFHIDSLLGAVFAQLNVEIPTTL